MTLSCERIGSFCQMCGAVAGDYWQTRQTRPVILSVRRRAGDPGVLWTLCNECHEGLRSIALHKKGRVHRLGKFGMVGNKKP